MNGKDKSGREDTECRVEGCDFTGSIKEVAEHFREEHDITDSPSEGLLLDEYSSGDESRDSEGVELDVFEEND